jgi:Mg2+ and Co2+ transporter CorA
MGKFSTPIRHRELVQIQAEIMCSLRFHWYKKLTVRQYFRMIETNKDKQEKAALAFTTVTVFFLPLTMLASVFGMNSFDIRNMDQGQGLFWITAVPFCMFGLGLWLHYLGTFKSWMRTISSWREKTL